MLSVIFWTATLGLSVTVANRNDAFSACMEWDSYSRRYVDMTLVGCQRPLGADETSVCAAGILLFMLSVVYYGAVLWRLPHAVTQSATLPVYSEHAAYDHDPTVAAHYSTAVAKYPTAANPYPTVA